MRQAGTLSNREQAKQFADYLLTQGISARVDAAADQFAIWIRDEDRVAQAREELERFVADPRNPRYVRSAATAQTLRKQQAQEEVQHRKNYIEIRDRWDTLPVGRRPLTMLLIAACVVVAIATDAGERGDSKVLDYLWFAKPPANILDPFTWYPTKSIDQGQVWRLVTPIFIHFGIWHLAFNMYWLYQFGSLIEVRRGTLRFGLLVLTVAVISNYSEYFFPYRMRWGDFSPFFGGMSGVGYGLFGYLWIKSRFDPTANMYVHPNIVLLFIVWFVLCWSGVLNNAMGHTANWAHTGGLVAGMAIAYAPLAWKRLNR